MKRPSSLLLIHLVLLMACQNSPATRAWYTQLPACPCQNPDLLVTIKGDGWAKDLGNISHFHRGATVCFRSYPAVKTSQGLSGQQCCYDATGKLIKSHSGAGTPDKISTCSGEDEQGIMTLRYAGLIGHYLLDVLPFEESGPPEMAWVHYNQAWKPNQGKACL